ncbi:MAG: hypothetical protein OEV66_05015 [Spirochaetia bacterium]|nr:hypothetical protein [Spirochaetia bacterium]
MKHKLKNIFIFFIISVSMVSCARFKVEKLSPNELFSIPVDRKPDHLNFPEQKGLYYEIPGRIAVVDDWLVVSESSNKVIKIFKDNKLHTLISSENNKKNPAPDEKKDSKKEDFQKIFSKHLNVPGGLAAGKEDDFYAINFIAPSETNKGDEGEPSGFYKILHFDVKGKFLHMIGRQAKMDVPFESILWMDVDDDNNLWVLYKYVEEIVLDEYKDGELIHSISQKDCEAALFNNVSIDKSEIAQCEQMYPFNSDKKVLMIGRIDKLPEKKSDVDSIYVFQHRVYKTKNLKNGKIETIFDNMNDPEDYPYLPYSSNILIWKTVRVDRFKLAVYDTDGDLVKYFQIDLPGKRNSWRSTYTTLSGKFYSLRVHNKSLHVVQWK